VGTIGDYERFAQMIASKVELDGAELRRALCAGPEIETMIALITLAGCAAAISNSARTITTKRDTYGAPYG
jgi:hypothetical protein